MTGRRDSTESTEDTEDTEHASDGKKNNPVYFIDGKTMSDPERRGRAIDQLLEATGSGSDEEGTEDLPDEILALSGDEFLKAVGEYLNRDE